MNRLPPPVDGIIFDMDGVLFDSEALHVQAWVEVGRLHGLGLSAEWVGGWVGRPDYQLVQTLRQMHGEGKDLDGIFAEKQSLFGQLTESELKPFAGLAERLEGLRRRGVPIAICTSTTTCEASRMLASTGLAASFEILVAAEDVARHKPDPAPYLEAARRLGLSPERCAVIEDSPPGLASAVAAGCHALAVTTSFPAEVLAMAEAVFPSTVAAIDWLGLD